MIELIIVIVIIGILAAIAVPRYLDFRSQARVAARDGITGNLRAAASIAYANASVNNPGQHRVAFPHKLKMGDRFLSILQRN